MSHAFTALYCLENMDKNNNPEVYKFANEIPSLVGLPKFRDRKDSVWAWEFFGFPELVGPDYFLNNNVYLDIMQN